MTRIQSISSAPWYRPWTPGVLPCSVRNPVLCYPLIRQPGLPAFISFCQFPINSSFFITHFILINGLYVLTQKIILWIGSMKCWIIYVHTTLWFCPCPLCLNLTYYNTSQRSRARTNHTAWICCNIIFYAILKGTVLKKPNKTRKLQKWYNTAPRILHLHSQIADILLHLLLTFSFPPNPIQYWEQNYKLSYGDEIAFMLPTSFFGPKY